MTFWNKKRVYLDWAAAAPVNSAAHAAYDAAVDSFGNPSSPHTEGRASRDILEAARVAIARELEVKADDVIFTSGATEANNLAIVGHVEALLQSGKKPSGIHIMYLPSAHTSVVETVHALEKKGISADPLPVKDGKVDLVELKKLIRPETALISMDYVCGETGTIWNVREVRQILIGAQKNMQSENSSILLHVDASQAPLVESVERARLACDMMTLDAQKVGGVRGIGLLVASRAVPLVSLMQGGGQERDLRPGTQTPANASSFAAALLSARTSRISFAANAAEFKKKLLSIIETIPNIVVNGGVHTVPHILNVSFLGRDTDYLLALIDKAGFAVSTKSACESDSEEGSRAVTVLTGDTERAKSTLRISWGPTTKKEDVERFGKELIRAIQFIDATRL